MGGGGVNLIQAMPEFWEHLVLAPLPKMMMMMMMNMNIIPRKCDSRQFSTKVRKSFLRVKMLNRCGFWGKKGHFVGKLSLLGDE